MSIRMFQLGVDAFRQPPPPAFLLTHFDDGANWSDAVVIDEYSGAVQTWPRETKIKTDQSVFGGSSGRFKGAFLTSPDSADWDLAGGDFTIEARIRFESGFLPAGSGNERVICGQWESANGYGWLLQAELNVLRFYWRVGGTQYSAGGGFIWGAGPWYHVAVSRSGDTFRVYVNGLLVGTTTQAGVINNSSDLLCICTNRDRAIIGNTFMPITNARNFYGWIDELVIWKGTAKYTAVNPGGYPNVWAPSGNVQIDTAKSKFGGSSLLMPQAGDQLRAAGGTQFDFGTGDFTIEAWVWITDLSISRAIFGHWTAANKFLLYVETSGTLRWGPSFVQTTGLTVGTGAWHHVVACKVSGYLRLFIDGVIGFAGVDSTNVTGTTIMEIGNSGSPSGTPYWVDDLRVTKGVARYRANVLTLPVAEFDNTDPDYASVKALLHFNGVDGSTTFTDDIGHTFIANGNAQIKTTQSKFGGASLGNFAAGTDCVTQNAADYAGNDFKILINTPFTIECWVYWNGVGGNQYIIGKIKTGNDTNDDTHTEWLFHLVNSTTLRLYYGHRGVNQTLLDFPFPAISTGAWHHLALFRDASNRIGCTVDGILSSKTYVDGKQLVNIAKPLTIGGAETAGFAASFNGFMDELRFTPGVCRYPTFAFTPPVSAHPDDVGGDPDFANVSALLHFDDTDGSITFTDQVTQYAFTPPVAAYDNTDPDFANCKLLMHFDGADDSSVFTDEIGHVITSHRENNIARTDAKKFGLAGYHLLGFSRACGAHLTDDPKIFKWGGGDFTIEFWWQNYSSNAGVGGDIMGKRASSVAFGPIVFIGGGYFSARRLFLFMSSNGTSWNLVNGLLVDSNFGGFQYISVSRQGSNVYVHKNGVLVTTIAIGAVNLYDNAGVPFVIGNCADGSSPGSGVTLDELRISKGIGWYGAANYTIPTGPWPNP